MTKGPAMRPVIEARTFPGGTAIQVYRPTAGNR